MKIKLIDYGCGCYLPKRAHANDAGADVHALHNEVIYSHQTKKIPLGLGLCLPDGFAACVFPRSSMASKGVTCEIPPIDSGYRGEIHAIITNNSDAQYNIEAGDRIGQLVIFPVVLADFVKEEGPQRGNNGFGSTGK